jgi:GNAT superfamily N-acetyltransferase
MNGASREVLIRPIRVDDLGAFRTLRLEALRTCPLAFTADLAQSEARPIEAWREQVSKGSGEGTDVIMLADAGEGGLAGMSGVFTPSQPKLSHVGTVWGVYVRPAYRGRGVGEALIRACVGWARGRGLVGLKLSVVEGNGNAHRLYERCGFAAYGVEPHAVRWEGKFFGETLLGMCL